MTSRILSRQGWLALISLSLMTISCGPAESPQPGPSPVSADSSANLLDQAPQGFIPSTDQYLELASAFDLLYAQTHWVSPADRIKYLAEFKARFEVKNSFNALVKFKTTDVTIERGSLEKAVADFLVAYPITSLGENVGVMFHHGLDKMKYTTAVSIWKMTRAAQDGIGHYWTYDTTSTNTQFYQIDPADNKLKLKTPAQYATWRDTYAKAYFDSVWVQPTKTAIARKVVRSVDTQCDVYTWEPELMLLLKHNPTGDALTVSCMSSENLVDGINFRHALILHSTKSGADQLTPPPAVQGKPYQGKAANIGSLCPPHCGQVRVLEALE